MFVIADTLTTTDPTVAGAVTGGDRRWLELHARRLVESGAAAIDLNASNLDHLEPDVLGWMAEVVEAVVDVPLAIDGPRLDVVAGVASGRRRPPILNSWSLDAPITEALLAAVARPGVRLVVQLRDGARLPSDARERRHLTERARRRWEEHGIGPERLLFDGVALPWGDDMEAGRGLLAFVAGMTADEPECTTLVGLGNVGHGHREPLDAQRRWLEVLAAAGLGAVLLDPTRPALQPLWRA